MLKFLIDTGSSKNYIRPDIVSKPINNQQIFYAKSIAGDVKVCQHTFISLFGLKNTPIKFFLLPSLKTFHGILGNDSLKQLSAVIYTKDSYMLIGNQFRIKIKQLKSQSVNSLDIQTLLEKFQTSPQKNLLLPIMQKNLSLFADPNEKLTYTTKIIAEIRTSTEEPVHSRHYPFPMSLKEEVEKQVQQLLDDGIIRPSRSPYNSPVWIVPKKADSSGTKQYRMVIDYRKLNTVTIADRYPIPDINEVIAHLGRNTFFSVLDLKSGFHQIPLRESDIEKTSFSINNGKYEFVRLPFGLKNAPAIFQRTLDDILNEYIGKFCQVYVDDIIIYSKNEADHAKHIETIFETLRKANMKVQLDKCKFFQTEVVFLGFIISASGIKTNPEKVKAILDFPKPETLKELRSFLGLSGYYRRFVNDYAKLAKPLTALLRGEEGRVSKTKSAKSPVHLNDEAIKAFQKLKNALVSQDIMLAYPDYSKPFDLTTDASNFAIGAVLEQGGKPITFISRTLIKAEENFAANEKELLAIVWALSSLRSYLYGSAKVRIFTDHQPLTFALSNKNSNTKMKRWKARLEEYNYELRYKPGKTNVVADALSRAPIHADINTLTVSQHSDESSGQELLQIIEAPINGFKNQIILAIGSTPSYEFKIVFPTYHRHNIVEINYTRDKLVSILKKYLNPSVTNVIKTEENILGLIQEIYPTHFRQYKARFSRSIVVDLIDEVRQEEEIIKEHNRAHRNARENRIQISQNFFFPNMKAKTERIAKACKVCKENKYERHPNNPELQPTPIPEYPGQIIHIDIYFTDKKIILTGIDKFSKYALAKILKSRSAEDIKEPLRGLILAFGVPQTVVMDNEKSLGSSSITFMLENMFGITVFKAPPYASCVNGQVERFHSTLSELIRCLKTDNLHSTFSELLDRSIYEYNRSIHSTTQKKPVDIFFGRRLLNNPEELEHTRRENMAKIQAKQQVDLNYHNKKKKPLKVYQVGEIIYVKANKRVGNKLDPRYKKEEVLENYNSTVKTRSGRIVHKSLIKN